MSDVQREEFEEWLNSKTYSEVNAVNITVYEEGLIRGEEIGQIKGSNKGCSKDCAKESCWECSPCCCCSVMASGEREYWHGFERTPTFRCWRNSSKP